MIHGHDKIGNAAKILLKRKLSLKAASDLTLTGGNEHADSMNMPAGSTLHSSLLLLILLLSTLAFAQQPTPPLAFTHVTVIDVVNGTEKPDVTVLVHDGRITSISEGPPPKGVTQISSRGQYLLPGLWDMHVHLSWTGNGSALPVLIANGITSVRDLGGKLTQLDDWRARINAGVLVGPRILRVGPILNGKSFNQYQLVPGSPDETRGVVRGLHAAGVDAIKVHRRMERDSYFTAIDEAKKLGLPLVGHIPMSVTPEQAVDAGQATIEHVVTIFEGTFSAGFNDEKELTPAMRRFLADGSADRLFDRFVAHKTVFDPTLVPYFDPYSLGPHERYVSHSLKESFLKQSGEHAISDSDRAAAREQFEVLKEVVRAAHRRGVLIVTGTDLAAHRAPGFPLHQELALLVQSGLTALEALQAATINSARAVGKERELGTIEIGKIADLVLLGADPLADIHNTERISAVIVSGRLYRRADLDRLLTEGEKLAEHN